MKKSLNTMLQLLVIELRDWPEDCGEYASWDATAGPSLLGGVVFTADKPKIMGRSITVSGVWALSEVPYDGKTAIVTRSQWMLACRAAAVKPNDEWAAQQSEKYPAYWRAIPAHWTHLDTYRINQLFPVEDDSGAILHARKKLLLPGVRTGQKGILKDVTEAVSTLNCYINK